MYTWAGMQVSPEVRARPNGLSPCPVEIGTGICRVVGLSVVEIEMAVELAVRLERFDATGARDVLRPGQRAHARVSVAWALCKDGTRFSFGRKRTFSKSCYHHVVIVGCWSGRTGTASQAGQSDAKITAARGCG